MNGWLVGSGGRSCLKVALEATPGVFRGLRGLIMGSANVSTASVPRRLCHSEYSKGGEDGLPERTKGCQGGLENEGPIERSGGRWR